MRWTSELPTEVNRFYWVRFPNHKRYTDRYFVHVSEGMFGLTAYGEYIHLVFDKIKSGEYPFPIQWSDEPIPEPEY